MRDIFNLLNTFNMQYYVVGDAAISKIRGQEFEGEIEIVAIVDKKVLLRLLNESNIKPVKVTSKNVKFIYNHTKVNIKVTHQSNIKQYLSHKAKLTTDLIAVSGIDNSIVNISNSDRLLADNKISTCYNTNQLFSQEPYYIIKLLRTAATFDLNIDYNVEVSMKENAHLLSMVSPKVITSELRKLLTLGKPIKKYLMKYSYIIFQIFPELQCTYKFNQHSKYHTHDVYEHSLYVLDGCNCRNFEINLAALLHDIGKPAKFYTDKNGNGHFTGHPLESYNICKEMLKNRLSLHKKEYDNILLLIKEHDVYIDPSIESIRVFIARHNFNFFMDWLILKQSDINDHVNLDTLAISFNIKAVKQNLLKVLFPAKIPHKANLRVSKQELMRHIGIDDSETADRLLDDILDKVAANHLDNSIDNIFKYIDSYMGVGVLE